MWIARDKNGTLVLHRDKPYTVTEGGMWLSNHQCMIIDKTLLPEVTYLDSPKEVIVTLK